MTAAPRSAIRELLSLLKPYRPIVISSITLGIIGGLSVTALLATVNRGLHSADGMGTGVVLAFAGLCLLALLSSIGADIGTNFVGQKVIAKLRKDLGAKVLAAPIEQIERYRTHRLIPVLTHDVDTISDFAFAFAPLFGHQYAACWIDLRGVADAYLREKGIDYFENSRRATLAQRAYAIANPGGWRDYGDDVWGLTACDGPANIELSYNGRPRRFTTYMARGAAADAVIDDGTIAPTAAGGSIPFAPKETIHALKSMRERYGDRLYGEYGFRDAFNPSFRYTDVKPQRGVVEPERGWF